MKTYTILFAEDVPHYGFADIEAVDDDAAVAAARIHDLFRVTTDPDWNSTVCRRIVRIDDADGNAVAENVALDEFHLRNGGEADRLLCEAAADLLEAAEQADLACTVRERASGHRTGCWMPDLSAAIARARGRS